MKSRETEAALVIRSDKAAQIANQIARIEALGAYRLEPQATLKIRDIYFDTPDQLLQKQKLALRIRQVNGRTFITLKGPAQKKTGGGQERLEIELTWSFTALTRLVRELRAREIEIKLTRQDFMRTDPVGTLKRLGFVPIQDRTTIRQVRKITAADQSGEEELAELAVDAVTYRLGKQAVRLHEIELEAKHEKARLNEMIQPLEKMFKPALLTWQSKLATGRALQTLLEDGKLAKYLDDQNNLKPKAYAKLGEILSKG